MAKKPERKSDYHKSGFMVRLPERFRDALDEVRVKTRRPMTIEVQIALEDYLKANGVTLKPAK